MIGKKEGMNCIFLVGGPCPPGSLRLLGSPAAAARQLDARHHGFLGKGVTVSRV